MALSGPLANTIQCFPFVVQRAVADWHTLFAEHVATFNARTHEQATKRAVTQTEDPFGDEPTVLPVVDADADMDGPPSPYSDEARTAMLRELHARYYVTINMWTEEEVELFVRLAFPRQLLLDLTRKGEPSAFLALVFDMWRPDFFQWVLFLWNLSGHACEFFADILFVMPDNQKPSFQQRIMYNIIGKVLFHDMVIAGHFRPHTCASLISAIFPFSRERSCARKHADFLSFLWEDLSVETIGFIIRCIIIHLAQPADCACGYSLGAVNCTCFTADGGGNVLIFEYDVNREYICILLKLTIERLSDQRKYLRTPQGWTDHERDVLIMSACNFVFTDATYIAVYNNLVATGLNADFVKPTIRLPNPRPISHEEEDMMFGGRDRDVENGKIQTGSCVVLNCRQISKENCRNVSCQTHCSQGIISCHVHRFYPTSHLQDNYIARRNVMKNRGTPVELRKNEKLIARDADDI